MQGAHINLIKFHFRGTHSVGDHILASLRTQATTMHIALVQLQHRAA